MIAEESLRHGPPVVFLAVRVVGHWADTRSWTQSQAGAAERHREGSIGEHGSEGGMLVELSIVQCPWALRSAGVTVILPKRQSLRAAASSGMIGGRGCGGRGSHEALGCGSAPDAASATVDVLEALGGRGRRQTECAHWRRGHGRPQSGSLSTQNLPHRAKLRVFSVLVHIPGMLFKPPSLR